MQRSFGPDHDPAASIHARLAHSSAHRSVLAPVQPDGIAVRVGDHGVPAGGRVARVVKHGDALPAPFSTRRRTPVHVQKHRAADCEADRRASETLAAHDAEASSAPSYLVAASPAQRDCGESGASSASGRVGRPWAPNWSRARTSASVLLGSMASSSRTRISAHGRRRRGARSKGSNAGSIPKD